MAVADLNQLVVVGDLDAFEARCLELLEQGGVRLADLVGPFEQAGGKDAGPRLGTLAQMVLEAPDAADDPSAALRIARTALLADPGNAGLRATLVELYRRVYADTAGIDLLIEQCGLAGDKPARNAVRALDFCLELRPGQALLDRGDGVVVQVAEIDHARGMYTLLRSGRPTTLLAAELARRYEPIDPDDFRVLRALRPERLRELLEADPVALVTGMIRAHGDWIDQESLKSDLVPRYLPESGWSKWWTRTRALLKKSANVVIEGRAPVILRYTQVVRSAEDEAWRAVHSRNDPLDWLETLGAYLRDKRNHRQPPDAGLIERVASRVVEAARAGRARRPAEALATCLVGVQIVQQAAVSDERPAQLARELLATARDPADLIRTLETPALWEAALTLLAEARPADAAAREIELLPVAPAEVIDRIVTSAAERGLTAAVQSHVDSAVADPLDFPELTHWLWRGPKDARGLRLPPDDELLMAILTAWAGAVRDHGSRDDSAKRFRQRVKAALGVKDMARARACLTAMDEARAVTVRERLNRIGDDTTAARLREIVREAHPQLWRAPERRLEPWEDPNVLWTTKSGLDRKTAERDQLVNVTMRDNARRIGEAAAYGDLSENSEYKFALEERDLLRARLAQMNQELSLARVVEPGDVPEGVVGVGSRVRLRCTADGRERTLVFLGPFDGDAERGILNYRAPTAQLLMGRRIGERVTLTFDGVAAEHEVVDISNGLT